ncbi:MAG TPA: sortase [Candidatus Saccharimonadales bacterium]|nr:sortase [Candidatus Saccharimonadales bacterium]
MHSSEDGKDDQFDAYLRLPDSAGGSGRSKDDKQAAADLIRKRIQDAYADEPDAAQEIKEAKAEKPSHRSKHQQFIYELTNSGRPLHEIQTAWHEYYAGLPDAQKHEVWREFYSAHAAAAKHPAVAKKEPKDELRPRLAKKVQSQIVRAKSIKPALEKHAAAVRRPSKKNVSQASPLHSLLFGLGVGSIVILIFLFSFFNDRIIAPFIQPSRNATDIPLISGGAVGKEPEVIIPKINAEVPVVYDVNTTADEAIQIGLTEGVVHYPTSPEPGQNGNVVIVGHSSGNIFNMGNYKFAFSLLRELDSGDTFFLQKDGKRYTYQVYKKQVVKPTDVAVLGPADKPATATLITCDPPGLSTNRLVVTAEQISPDPSANAPASKENIAPATATTIPGNSPSLWSRLVKWFTS